MKKSHDAGDGSFHRATNPGSRCRFPGLGQCDVSRTRSGSRRARASAKPELVHEVLEGTTVPTRQPPRSGSRCILRYETSPHSLECTTWRTSVAARRGQLSRLAGCPLSVVRCIGRRDPRDKAIGAGRVVRQMPHRLSQSDRHSSPLTTPAQNLVSVQLSRNRLSPLAGRARAVKIIDGRSPNGPVPSASSLTVPDLGLRHRGPFRDVKIVFQGLLLRSARRRRKDRASTVCFSRPDVSMSVVSVLSEDSRHE